MDERIIDIIELLRTQHNMFIGKSFEKLVDFINIYNFALQRECGINHPFFMSDFGFFIAEKYSLPDTSKWNKMITFISMDDEAAFDNFYKLYDEYMEKEKQCRK